MPCKLCCTIFICFLVNMVFSCRIKDKPVKEARSASQPAAVSKPGAYFQDTLEVTVPSAVFYTPDSAQFKKIKAVTDKRIFEGSTHEFFYLQRNAHIFLKQHWPQL